MDLTFFPARAKWRSSQSPRRGVPWLCLTGADIVRDGVMGMLQQLSEFSADTQGRLHGVTGGQSKVAQEATSDFFQCLAW